MPTSLATYSCGGSRGIAAIKPRTAFPITECIHIRTKAFSG